MENKTLILPAALMLLATLGSIIIVFAAIKKVSFKYALFTAFALFTWASDQAIQSFTGLYKNFSIMPPLLILYGVMPMVIAMVVLFSLKRSREVIGALPLALLSVVHFFRLPVEYMIYLLSEEEKMPRMMTFNGGNYDIIIGITALPVAWLLYKYKDKFKYVFAVWSAVGLFFVLRVSAVGILSSPYPFRKYLEDYANTAVFEFPFALLPAFMVPVVVFAHIVALYRIFVLKTTESVALKQPVEENII